MGKALVIKGTNFSGNKLTTVNLTDLIPCTSIILDKSTYAFSEVGASVTLVPTVAPANTTDTVEWSTSDSNVATVENGVVSCVGVGSATITATCGLQTATCSITATQELSFTYQMAEKATKASSPRDYGEINPATSSYAGLFNTTIPTTKKVRKATSSQVPATNVYPILLPMNAEKINASVPSDVKITVWFLNSEVPAEYSSGQYAAYAKVIYGDANEYDSSVAFGDRIITVPEGVDSVIFSLYKQNNVELPTTDVESVSLVVS